MSGLCSGCEESVPAQLGSLSRRLLYGTADQEAHPRVAADEVDNGARASEEGSADP